jgi:putative oxidoreductase
MSGKYTWIDPLARLLMALLFLISATTKVMETSGIQAYMQAFGVPAILVWPAAALEYAGGALLLIGFHIRLVSLVLAGWCVLTAVIFHTDFADLGQLMNFFKNMTMAGSFLLIARVHPAGLSLDSYVTQRKAATT